VLHNAMINDLRRGKVERNDKTCKNRRSHVNSRPNN
jgi:hypothetical protein